MNKIFAVLLSFIVLLSSLNYRLSAHYCGQTIVDVALFGEAEVCLMVKEKGCKSDEMPCCADRDLIIEGEDFLSARNFENVQFEKTKVLAAVLEFPILLLLEKQKVSLNAKEYYTPPLIEQKSQALFQTFLL